MTPAERLRAAADRLDALDQAATPGPWHVDGPSSISTIDTHRAGFPGVFIGTAATAAEVDLIATLRGVVKPLATWLRCEAASFDACPDFGMEPDILAISDAILGGSDD